LLATGFIASFCFLVSVAQRVPLLALAENFAADWIAYFAEPGQSEQHPEIVILGITEDTLNLFPFRFPINRDLLARTLETLAQHKVKAVALDILFDQPTIKESDEAFLKAAKSMPVPLVVAWTDAATLHGEKRYEFQRKFLDGIRAGFVNMSTDESDGTVRLAIPGQQEATGWRSSFAGTIAEALGKTAPREAFRINFRPGPNLDTPRFRSYPLHSIAILLKARPTLLDGKIVIIGADLPFEDRHRTPQAAVVGSERGTIPGTQVQAHILAHLLGAEAAKGRNPPIEWTVTLMLAVAALSLARWEQDVATQSLVGVAVVVALWAGAALLYWKLGIILPVFAPTLVFGIGLFAVVSYFGHLRRLEGQFVREAFSRYVSPRVLSKLEANPGGLQVGGEKREISVLFTDIEGFTTFAEKQEPTVLINVLNRYLDALTDEVQRFDGMVDKFIGDAVMAVFGALDPQPDHATRAIQCALAMREASERLMRELKQEGFALGRTRVGAHSGFAVVGNVGGERRFDYTALGDVVNTASRLEAANKYFGTQVCLSGETCRMAGFNKVRPIGRLVVKGKTEGLPVMTPVTDAEMLQTDSYVAAYELMAAGRGEAIEAFMAHVKKWPEDRLALFHLDRLKTGKIDDRIVLEGK